MIFSAQTIHFLGVLEDEKMDNRDNGSVICRLC